MQNAAMKDARGGGGFRSTTGNLKQNMGGDIGRIHSKKTTNNPKAGNIKPGHKGLGVLGAGLQGYGQSLRGGGVRDQGYGDDYISAFCENCARRLGKNGRCTNCK